MLQGPRHKNHTCTHVKEQAQSIPKQTPKWSYIKNTLCWQWQTSGWWFFTNSKNSAVFSSSSHSLCIFSPSLTFVVFLGFFCFLNLMCGLSTKNKSNRKLHSQHQSGTEPGYVNWFVVPKFLEERRKKFLLLKLGPHPYVSIVFFLPLQLEVE